MRRVLAERVFSRTLASTDVAPQRTFLEIVWGWLVQHVFGPLFAPLARAFSAAQNVGTAVGVILAVVALAALAFVLVRLALAFAGPGRRAQGTRAALAPAADVTIDAAAWRARASDAAGRADYALAIAALWMAALCVLDERALVAFDPARTPGEYSRLVRRSRAPAAAPFASLGERFVYATYARARALPADYDAALAAFLAFEPAARGPRMNAALRALRRVPPLEAIGLVVAVGVLVALALARSAQSGGATLDSYSSYDAASGGYRAFYELLARERVREERFEQHPAFLDAHVDTLVWAEPLPFDTRQIAPTRGDIGALEAWVRAGGRLLYVGFDETAAARGILFLPRTALASGRRGRETLAEPLARAGVRGVRVSASRRYRVTRRGVRVLLDDGRGAVALTYAFGRGRVVALVDESLFTNAAIANRDAARLAVALASPGRANGVVSFAEAVHGYIVPQHWWQIVPRRFVLALALAALALAVAFAGSAVRLGPPLLAEEGGARTTADFIDALASLLARGKAAGYVLEAAQRSTARVVARALGLASDAPDAEILAFIEDDASRAAFATLSTLVASAYADNANLVRGVGLAQRLRKEYAAYGRPRN